MNLREQLFRDEGVRLKPYKDSVGKLTIGVGRNLTDVGISMAEADLLLDNDITRAAAAVMARIPFAASLGEVRFAVLVNMAYNLGIAGLMKFTQFLADVEKGDFAVAAVEMLNSTWAQQVGARAERLSKQLETNEWQ